MPRVCQFISTGHFRGSHLEDGQMVPAIRLATVMEIEVCDFLPDVWRALANGHHLQMGEAQPAPDTTIARTSLTLQGNPAVAF